MKTLLLIAVFVGFYSNALAYLSHDEIVKNIKSSHVGKQPKIKHKVIYNKASEVGKKSKKKEQKMGRKSVVVTPTPAISPSPSVAPSAAPSATPVGSATPASGEWWKTANGVDLRACDGPIEEQQTPWCTAFSLKGVMETMLCNHERLSARHVWSLYQQYSVDAASKSVPGKPITIWDKWAEDQSKPSPDYLSFAKHKLTGMHEIDTDDNIAAALAVLDTGKPVYIGMAVPSDVASCYSVIRPNTQITSGGHALEIVGYGKGNKADGTYFIIKNSWGTDCHDRGYFYMPSSVCSLNKMYCYMYYADGVQ
jgi:hypothetical protein